MADFSSFNQRSTDAQLAISFTNSIRNVYQVGAGLRSLLALYQSGSNQGFNGVVDELYTAAQRQELGVMVGQLNTLLADWEANHGSAIGIS